MSHLLVEKGTNLLVTAAVSATVENNVETVFDFTVAEDVITRFLKGVPEVTGYEIQQGPWGQKGAYRWVHFGEDKAREEINFIQRPYLFDYQLTDFTAELKDMVDLAVAQFLFRPVGPRTEIKWYYNFRAKSEGVLPQLQDFVENVWVAWMKSYLNDTKEALDKDVFAR
ncbi:SRPBCC family protein [uncultured Aquimarina sp.]|uniref:SRPBCC family protein n=1 Tax=uncultured Aquimarina sp. TaxID=575652 RepID=UPI00261BD9ED|nr:SRPBCC family protein [uncultured Aquimarina sp.]